MQVVINETDVLVHFDDTNPDLLPGTAHTLNETSRPAHLQPGLISRAGWVPLDDTPNLLFDTSSWLEPRPARTGYRDLYLLVCAHYYKAALQDYQRVANTPSIPNNDWYSA